MGNQHFLRERTSRMGRASLAAVFKCFLSIVLMVGLTPAIPQMAQADEPRVRNFEVGQGGLESEAEQDAQGTADGQSTEEGWLASTELPKSALTDGAAAVDEVATSDDAAESQLIVVYEDEALALDDDLEIEAASDTSAEAGANAGGEISNAGAEAAEASAEASAEAMEQETAEPGKSNVAAEAPATLEDAGVVSQDEVAQASGSQGAVAVVELADGVDADGTAEQLEQAPGIAYVQPNYSYAAMALPNDPYCASESGTTAQGQYYLLSAGFDKAWELARAEGAVTVAVLDTGCDLEHEDLEGTVDAEYAYDVTAGAPLANCDWDNGGDPLGHGTAVAGVAAAQAGNGLGIAGASYNARVLPVKVFDEAGQCTTADLLAAYAYLEGLMEAGEASNLRVVNLSLGYYAQGEGEQDRALREAIASMRADYGVLTVCAGGNSQVTGEACYPADFEECVSVAALSADGSVAASGESAATRDIAAPGEDVLTARAGGGYEAQTGSSMAAPQVSAAAALLWAADPSLTADEVADALKGTAFQVEGAPEGDATAGALDAGAAVARVLGLDGSEAASAEAEDSGVPDADAAAAGSENGGSAGGSGDVAAARSDEDPSNATPAEESTEADAQDAGDDATTGVQPDPLINGSGSAGDTNNTGNAGNAGNTSDPLAESLRFIMPFATIASTWTRSGTTWSTMLGNSKMTVTNAKRFGIDVSEHNGDINWAKAKAAGVQFAIIRCGYGNNDSKQDDKKFIQNVQGCIDNNIPFGIYIFSYGYTESMAKSEADHVLRLLKAAKLSPSQLAYPVYYDLEYEGKYEYVKLPCGLDDENVEHCVDKTTLGKMATAFCQKISAAGYTPGIYANANWFQSYLTASCFKGWTKWVANYPAQGVVNAKSSYAGTHDMWQCMSTGKVNGISGFVDIDFDYKGFGVGQLKTDSKGIKYVFPDGNYAVNDWRTVNGKTYYFGSNGYAVKWLNKIGGKYYYFNGSCVMHTGWLTWKADGKRSYFNSDGSAATGWTIISGKKYYFDPATTKAAKWLTKISGKYYYFNAQGVMHTGWLTWKADGRRSYFKSDGSAASGWTTISNKKYYFDPSTTKAAKWLTKISGKYYYFNSQNVMHTGWLTWKADGRRSYFKSDGSAAIGWTTISGKKYYFDSKTTKAWRWEHTINGKKYYFERSGVMHTGWLRWKADGLWSYYNSNGVMLTGKQKIGGVTYNFGTSGKVRR